MDGHTTGCTIDLGEDRIKKYLESNSFWVIENFDSNGNPKGVYIGYNSSALHKLGWVTIENAIRFVREEDADKIGKSLAGRYFGYYWKPTEHIIE